MTEQPTTIAREAKGIHQTLKELLKTKEPFDKEVDFQRKNLRRRYLSLLLVHPYAKESKDVENHLWMQTSYAFIASYKQRILNLDRMIQNKLKQPPQPANQRPNTHIVEHRKLVQRFRQFLADEEKFWTQLVVRLRRSFALHEATPALIALGIISEADEATAHLQESSDAGGPPSHGRNHFQFPAEDASTSFVPSTSEEKDAWLAILTKALICLGDIARYRELYNEAGGRPKAGQEEQGPRRGRNRRGGQVVEPMSRPRNYEKAQNCYEQAKLLVPSDGNPSHQLAIIATYRKDSFASLTHYYRALCVRTPYDTASENLGSVLSKALEQWRNRSKKERERMDSLPPRVQVDIFKENIVVLHALWKLGTEKGITKMESASRGHQNGFVKEFYELVSKRYLPTDMISNAIVISQGALWKHRMIRNPSHSAQSRRPEAPAPPEGTSVILEWHILDHLLDLHHAVLEVGTDELKVPPPRDAPSNDLAQLITGTFRRTLPALRIASKWLRANLKYMTLDHEFNALQQIKKAEGIDIVHNTEYQLSRGSKHTRRFWRAYAAFMTALSIAFPLSKLPPLTAPLEEDIEMRGFLPLKKMMDEFKPNVDGVHSTALLPLAQEAHPNDWQLMRIADLLGDARELTSAPNTPIMESYGIFRFIEEIMEPDVPSQSGPNENSIVFKPQKPSSGDEDPNSLSRIEHEFDDIETEIPTHVGIIDAKLMDEIDDDEIVWDLKPPLSSPTSALPSPTSHITPVAQIKPLRSPIRPSPTHSNAMSSFQAPNAPVNVSSTTAQDLLNVINGRTAPPQPALLFELPHPSGHNIWSASPEEQSLRFASQPNSNQTYMSKRFQGSTMDSSQSQSIWSSYPNGTQTSHHDIGGGLPHATYAQQPHSVTQGSHQRVPSIGTAQHFPNHHLGLQDPFAYPQPLPQQPIHRPGAHGLPNSTYMSPSMPPNNGLYYQNSHIPEYPSHHLSMNDPRLAQPFTPSMSQLWGNAG